VSSAYFDTSGALACLLTTRSGNRSAREAWAGADAVASVRLIHAEARAALESERRRGGLRPSRYAKAKQGWLALWEELVVIEADEQVVSRAGDLAERYGLRGCDAVHLAGAEASGCELLVSGDRDLCEASLRCGLAVLDLNRA
jgi:predicted nucleic acid-binding protein